VAQAYPIDWAGERIAEARRVSASSPAAKWGIAVVRSDIGALVAARWNGTLWETDTFGDIPGAPTDIMAIGIRDDGAATVYQNGVAVASGAVFDPTTDNIFIAAFVQDVDGESAEWQIITEGSQMTQYVDASLRDWCGQDTVPVWTPDELAAAGRDSFWTDLDQPETKYQDTLLTTSAGVADPLGGIRNLSAISTTPTLSQATTANKWVVDANGYAYRTGSVNTANLGLNAFTVNVRTGALFGWKFTNGITGDSHFIGGSTTCRIWRQGSTIGLRYGSSSTLSFSSTAEALNNASTLVVASGTGDRVYVYLDGEELGNSVHGISNVSQNTLNMGWYANNTGAWGFKRCAALSTVAGQQT
jgi:hypothetical protein